MSLGFVEARCLQSLRQCLPAPFSEVMSLGFVEARSSNFAAQIRSQFSEVMSLGFVEVE